MTAQTNPTGSDNKFSVRQIALNVGAIAGLICVLAASASFFFGIKPLVFRSGSMSPEITTGSLALSRSVPASNLAVGDVVSVLNQQGTRITHRVQEIVSSNENASVLILKGDANEDADLSPYTVTEADRVFFSVPSLGYVVAWLSSPTAIFLGGAFVGSLMVVAFRPAARKDDEDQGGDDSGASGGEKPAEPVSASVRDFDFDDAPTQQFEMPVAPVTKTRTLASRMLSGRALPARPLMAFGAVGVAALMATTSGTAAAFTDTGSVASTFGANANFYPTPVVTDTSCKDEGNFFDWDAIVSWDSLGKTPLGDNYEYQVVVVRSSDSGHVYMRKNVGTDTSIRLDIDDTGRLTHVQIHTVNGPRTSSGYRGQKVRAQTVTRTYCDGGEIYDANESWENEQSASGKSLSLASAKLASEEPVAEVIEEPIEDTADEPTDGRTDEPAEDTTDEPVEDATDESSDATDESVEDVTDESSDGSADESADESTDESDADAGADAGAGVSSGGSGIENVSPSGSFVATVSSSQVVITDESGSVLSSMPVGDKAAVQWAADAEEFWLADAGELFLVSASGGWEKAAADPESAEVPAGIKGLVQ
ncbi:signal peptidase I [Rhodococcus sp. NPDC049939]|uniref:signal peptidase I n=1 Tax=Rhodococcus sp. NPDC049939 TaxID=3155511 RepID=UPI0033C5C770